jgi:hypothetical protein
MILANHGIISSSGGALSFDADALAFITAVSITDNTQKTAVNTLVTDLKNANIWTKMKAIYPFLGGTGAKHRFNLIKPTTLFSDFYMTFYGGGTHSANGWKCNGVDACSDTSIVPITHMASNQNDMCFSAYVRDTVNNVLVGTDNNHRTVLAPNRTGVGIYIPLNSTDGSVGTTAPTGGGFYMNTRLDNTTVKLFKNGSLIHSRTNVTTGLDNLPIYLGARNTSPTPSVYSNNEIAFASIGSGLTDAEALAYYNAVQNYQSILSRQV